jgi:hypothetical protein
LFQVMEGERSLNVWFEGSGAKRSVVIGLGDCHLL